MNSVNLIGRLTDKPELRYTENKLAIGNFKIAINRMPGKNGEDRGADFILITVFGKKAENAVEYLRKGSMVAVIGRLRNDSYDKDGVRMYITRVIAENVEYLNNYGKKNEEVASLESSASVSTADFEDLDPEDIPF